MYNIFKERKILLDKNDYLIFPIIALVILFIFVAMFTNLNSDLKLAKKALGSDNVKHVGTTEEKYKLFEQKDFMCDGPGHVFISGDEAYTINCKLKDGAVIVKDNKVIKLDAAVSE